MAWMIPAIVISSPDLAKQVFKAEDSTFSFRPYLLVGEHSGYNFKGIALASGNHWKSMRGICTTELFTVKCIDSFFWVRMEELSYFVSSLAQACKDQSIVDAREHLTGLTLKVQTRILMSKRFPGENLSGDELAEARVFKDYDNTKFLLCFPHDIWIFIAKPTPLCMRLSLFLLPEFPMTKHSRGGFDNLLVISSVLKQSIHEIRCGVGFVGFVFVDDLLEEFVLLGSNSFGLWYVPVEPRWYKLTYMELESKLD
ncbi:hypothetical protein SELMODRAFT_419691 [Selaginella moellendorffii]|uniref:Uncharacterized protein CYP797E2 n=1 Tax=Selaginella moellendorffii TaxID=88036 RepID=D8S9R0_SELML|nr:hypothetical protein SELMODRAFT_419691 [Selaginella moellendorffii]